VAETCSPFDKPLLTPYYRKESCDLTVINKPYIVTLHNGMDTVNKTKPYCRHLLPARLYNILPHYLINGTILEKKEALLNTKCVF
jgi:hypothetical protein